MFLQNRGIQKKQKKMLTKRKDLAIHFTVDSDRLIEKIFFPSDHHCSKRYPRQRRRATAGYAVARNNLARER